MVESVQERLVSKIAHDLVTDCHLWTGRINRGGYGQLSLGGRTCLAHRLAYEQAHGPIPAELVVDHLCRTRHCVNPAHMEIVTQAENLRRGRKFAGLDVHCKHGHPWSDENTTTGSRGQRVCRECNRIKSKAYFARKRENPAAYEALKTRWRDAACMRSRTLC